MIQSQVKIGPNFFRKEKAAYSDWRHATSREFLQNSLDAKSTQVDILIEEAGDNIRLTVVNNGETMTKEVIVEKLLALGESGKNFDGTVGGFGLAKTLLYMSNESYVINSGIYQVTGCGGDYVLEETIHFPGTKSVVLIQKEPYLASNLEKQFSQFIKQCQRPDVTFTVNGESVTGNLKKGSRRREFDWGTVYTNKSFPNLLIVRLDGMPMFTQYIDNERCVVVELHGKSGDVLTANRDGLQWEQRRQLQEFVRQLSVDSITALKDTHTTTYTHYRGDRLKAKDAKGNMAAFIGAAYANVQKAPVAAPGEVEAVLGVGEPVRLNEQREVVEFEEGGLMTAKQPTISHEFLIRSELGKMMIPEHFTPDAFSEYSARLVRIWASLMLEIHMLFGNTDDFGVGFVFNETAEAMCEKTASYGTVFYVNPAVIKYNSFGGRSLAKRWKLNSAGKFMLLMDAVHEYCHLQVMEHNEEYAAHLTNVAAVVVQNLKRFHKCYR